MNLILVSPDAVAPDGSVRLAGAQGAHVVRILKAAPGHTIRIGMLDGPIGTGTVREISGEHVELSCRFEDRIPDPPAVDLLLALPRPKVMRRLWAQLAALGVGHVALTNAERVERDYFDTHLLDPKGYTPLLIEGLQQARDTRVPRVSIHRRFKVLVEDMLLETFGHSLRLVGNPAAETSPQPIVSVSREPRVLVAIGPEGGWNAFELGLLRAHGFHSVSLGPRTLRTDTACVALLALVHDALTSRITAAEAE